MKDQYESSDYAIQNPIKVSLTESSISIKYELKKGSKWKAALKSGSNEVYTYIHSIHT